MRQTSAAIVWQFPVFLKLSFVHVFSSTLWITAVVFVRRGSTLAAQRTRLYDFHVAHQGKIVDFGGFQLPVTYASENITESHLHTRKSCSIFDVSHMLQTIVTGANRHEFMESICTADIQGRTLSMKRLYDKNEIYGSFIEFMRFNKHLRTRA